MFLLRRPSARRIADLLAAERALPFTYAEVGATRGEMPTDGYAVDAYGASLGSTYNGRPRPPQILLAADGSMTVGRRRGSLASLA